MLVLLRSGKFSFSPLLFWFSFSILCFFSSCVLAALTFLFLFFLKTGSGQSLQVQESMLKHFDLPFPRKFSEECIHTTFTAHSPFPSYPGWRHLNFCFASLHWPSYPDFELSSCTHIHDDCLILVLSTTPVIGMRCPFFKKHNHAIEKDFLFF